MSEERRQRVEALDKLLTEFSQRVDDYDEGEEEDLRPYFNGSVFPLPWACITQNGTPGSYDYKTFFLLLASREEAQARAEQFIEDDIFVELPIAVVNLDTGERWNARPATKWEKQQDYDEAD